MPTWFEPEFEWDDDNDEHLIDRHAIFPEEAEQVFRHGPHVRRSRGVYYALGQDDAGRYLIAVFVVRGSKVRVILARRMNLQERRQHDRHR